MADAKYSAEDLKMESENVEYAGDLKKVSSGDAPDAVIVTEEDVSLLSASLLDEPADFPLIGPTHQEGHRQAHSPHPDLGLLAANFGQVPLGLCFGLRIAGRCCKSNIFWK
jgi:hypothetical protein